MAGSGIGINQEAAEAQHHRSNCLELDNTAILWQLDCSANGSPREERGSRLSGVGGFRSTS